MKRIQSFLSLPLFQETPPAQWTGRRRILYWVWNYGMVLAAGLGIGLVSLLLALGHYAPGIARGYFECPLILALNVLPVMALTLLFYGLLGRAHWAFLASAVVVLGFSCGNYYKLMFRDDPLMFADMLYLREAGNMAGQYHLFLDWKLILMLVCVVLGFVVLRFLVRGRPRRGGRIAGAAAGAAAIAALVPALLSPGIYDGAAAYYDRLSNRWSATQQYIAHGFVYPFLYSINEAVETPPAGYDAEASAALLSQYEDADIPEEKKVNILGIMLEAYNDFTRFGTVDLAADVYEVWHDLEAEGYSGSLLTNIFAGGTIDTERCFLTGYSNLINFRTATNAYPWYFQSQGYTVEGMHPCYDWFYNRQNVNAYLGFSNYYFVENYFTDLTGGGVALDDIFFPELLKTYQAGAAQDAPYFNFSVSYQGHGPYSSETCEWGELGDYVINDGRFTQEEQTILENYFGSIYNTNQHLKELTDYLREDEEPVVLILFGDHNPWMGDGNTVYEAMGLNLDLSTEEGFYNYYATRYIIWANDAAKEVLGSDFQGEGPTISPNFLMNVVFQQCGWEGPAYLQALEPVMEQVPVINTATGLYVENGQVTDTLSPEGAALVQEYSCLQYYRRQNFAYRTE